MRRKKNKQPSIKGLRSFTNKGGHSKSNYIRNKFNMANISSFQGGISAVVSEQIQNSEGEKTTSCASQLDLEEIKKTKKQDLINDKKNNVIKNLPHLFQMGSKKHSKPKIKIQIKQTQWPYDIFYKGFKLQIHPQCFMCQPQYSKQTNDFVLVQLISLKIIEKQLLRYVSALINSGSGYIVLRKKMNPFHETNKRIFIETITYNLNLLRRHYKFRYQMDYSSEKQAIKLYIEADDKASFLPAIFHKNEIGQYYIIDKYNRLASIEPKNIYEFAYKFLKKKPIICSNYKHKHFPDRRKLARSIKSTPFRNQISCVGQLTNILIWIKNAVQNQEAIITKIKQQMPFKQLTIIYEEIVDPSSRIYFVSFQQPFKWVHQRLKSSKQLGYSVIQIQKNLIVKTTETELHAFLWESACQWPQDTGINEEELNGNQNYSIVKLSFTKSSEAVMWYILLRQNSFKVFFGHKLYL